MGRCSSSPGLEDASLLTIFQTQLPGEHPADAALPPHRALRLVRPSCSSEVCKKLTRARNSQLLTWCGAHIDPGPGHHPALQLPRAPTRRRSVRRRGRQPRLALHARLSRAGCTSLRSLVPSTQLTPTPPRASPSSSAASSSSASKSRPNTSSRPAGPQTPSSPSSASRGSTATPSCGRSPTSATRPTASPLPPRWTMGHLRRAA